MDIWTRVNGKNFEDLARQLGELISAMRDDLGADKVAISSPPRTTGLD